jgi:hypothetical protein
MIKQEDLDKELTEE